MTLFADKIIKLIPLLLLLTISLKDDSIFHFKFLDFISCNFQYIIIYYWVLKKPEYLGYGYIFIAGIITDVIFGLPMGVSPLSFLIIAMLATYTRIVTVKINLVTDWIAFAPALLAANFSFFLVLYFSDISINYSNLFGTSFFTFIVYPFIWGIFEIFRRMARGI